MLVFKQLFTFFKACCSIDTNDCKVVTFIVAWNPNVTLLENVSEIEFLCQIHFLYSILFYKINSNNQIKKKLIQLSELNFNFNSTSFESHQIKQLNNSNNQIFELQITEIFQILNWDWNQFSIFHFCQIKVVNLSNFQENFVQLSQLTI